MASFFQPGLQDPVLDECESSSPYQIYCNSILPSALRFRSLYQLVILVVGATCVIVPLVLYLIHCLYERRFFYLLSRRASNTYVISQSYRLASINLCLGVPSLSQVRVPDILSHLRRERGSPSIMALMSPSSLQAFSSDQAPPHSVPQNHSALFPTLKPQRSKSQCQAMILLSSLSLWVMALEVPVQTHTPSTLIAQS